jgi:hypothetical protein
LLSTKKQKTKASEREKERDRSQTDQEDCLRQWRWNPWIAGDGYVQEHRRINLDFSKPLDPSEEEEAQPLPLLPSLFSWLAVRSTKPKREEERKQLGFGQEG